jgi:hypothetical protein
VIGVTIRPFTLQKGRSPAQANTFRRDAGIRHDDFVHACRRGHTAMLDFDQQGCKAKPVGLLPNDGCPNGLF